MSARRYVVRPKADQDLDNQAYYLATAASPEVGHRFPSLPMRRFPCSPHSPRWDGTFGSSIPAFDLRESFECRASNECSYSTVHSGTGLRFCEWYTARETSERSCVAKGSSEEDEGILAEGSML